MDFVSGRLGLVWCLLGGGPDRVTPVMGELTDSAGSAYGYGSSNLRASVWV
jgi:hypothetical protein